MTDELDCAQLYTDEPLGDGFDVGVYVTRMDDAPAEFGGVPAGTTIRYTSDYAVEPLRRRR